VPRTAALGAGDLGALRRAAHLDGRSIGGSACDRGRADALGPPDLPACASRPTWPSLHVVYLEGGALDVAGATIPGVPIFWTGRNRRVAWASTNARAVTVDLYTETLHPRCCYHDGRGGASSTSGSRCCTCAEATTRR
jgi:hypothetical protein